MSQLSFCELTEENRLVPVKTCVQEGESSHIGPSSALGCRGATYTEVSP